MNSLPLIHTSFAHPFVHYLDEKGCPSQRYVKMAKLPEKLLESADGLVSERYVYQMLSIAARREGIDDLGLRVASGVPVSILGALAEHTTAQPTLYAGLELFCRKISEDILSHIGFWLSRHDGNTWFCRTPPPSIDAGLRHPEQFALLFMIKLVRLFSGERWSPETIYLRSNNRNAFIDHPDFQKSDIHVNKSITAIKLPNPGYINQVSRIGLRIPDTATAEISQSLASALKLYLPEDCPNIKAAAELAGMSDRTLKRYLAKSGMTFKQLLQRLRFEEASRLLGTTDASIIDISNELSYNSPSNFARAFYRWAGMSPTEFRQQTRRV